MLIGVNEILQHVVITSNILPYWVLKNKHQAVSQGRYRLEARGLRLKAQKNQPQSAKLPASSLQLPADCM
jgi:hypothetical protein